MRSVGPSLLSRIRAGWVGAALLTLPYTTAAWSPPEIAQLPTLVVEGDAYPAEQALRRPFVTAAAPSAQPIPLTLAETLRRAPGVLLQESFGGFEPPRLSIRGSGAQSAPSSRGVVFLLEGLPLNLSDGSFNAAWIVPSLVSSIAVTRGSAGSADAGAVLGGALDLRLNRDAAPFGILRAQGGAFGRAEATLLTRSAAGSLVFDANANVSRQDGYREHSGQQRVAVLARAALPFPPGASITLTLFQASAKYDVPGPLTRAEAQTAPRGVSAEVVSDQPTRTAELTRLALQTEQHNSQLSLLAGLAWQHSTDWFRQLQANGISDGASDDLTVRAVLSRRFQGHTQAHALRGGLSYQEGNRRVARFNNDRGLTGRRFGDDRLRSSTLVAEVDDTVELTRTFAARVGVTGLGCRRDIDDLMEPAAGVARTTRDWSTSAVQPHARLVYLPSEAWRYSIGLARATEPPTFDDLIVVVNSGVSLARRSQSLLAQRATTLDANLSGVAGPLDVDFTAYASNWSNELLRLADARGLPRGVVNARSTRHAGLEAAVRWRLAQGVNDLSLVATAAYTRTSFRDDPIYRQNRVAGFPLAEGNLALLYGSPRGVFAAVELDWTAGATPVDHANRLFYGGHAFVSASLGWQSARGWRVYVGCRNVFDRNYVASSAGVLDLARNPAGTSVFLPGVGRTVLVGFERKLW